MIPKSAITLTLMTVLTLSCTQEKPKADLRILFLHHSTGELIWKGASNSKGKKATLPKLFAQYNKENNINYLIEEIEFPKTKPYGWNNYPYDYYNIWIKNAGTKPFMEEPTLELLTEDFDIILLKHCFPVSNIQEDSDSSNIYSDLKTISNYKLQYLAIKEKLNQFPDTKFIVFTGAAQTQANIKQDEAIRAKEFHQWVIKEWDKPGDNIYIWDLYDLQTEGGLYFRDDYAVSPYNSHPNREFAERASKLLFSRIIDIIDTQGDETQLTGQKD